MFREHIDRALREHAVHKVVGTDAVVLCTCGRWFADRTAHRVTHTGEEIDRALTEGLKVREVWGTQRDGQAAVVHTGGEAAARRYVKMDGGYEGLAIWPVRKYETEWEEQP